MYACSNLCTLLRKPVSTTESELLKSFVLIMIIVLLLFVYKTDVIHQYIIQFYNNNFSLQISSMLTLVFFSRFCVCIIPLYLKADKAIMWYAANLLSFILILEVTCTILFRIAIQAVKNRNKNLKHFFYKFNFFFSKKCSNPKSFQVHWPYALNHAKNFHLQMCIFILCFVI